jgi:hypothetical protein
MSTLNALNIPAGLKILVRKPPLLNGESKEEYYLLLREMIDYMGPEAPPEYVWIFNFTNWAWELSRYTHARAVLINGKVGSALRALVSDHRKLGELDLGWLIQNYRTELPKHGIDPDIVTSMAVGFASLRYIDATIETLQRRCDTIMQLLDGRRQAFEARARQKAAELRERDFHRARMEALKPVPKLEGNDLPSIAPSK